MKAWMPARRFAGIAVAAVGVWLGSAGAASAATNNIFTVAGTGIPGSYAEVTVAAMATLIVSCSVQRRAKSSCQPDASSTSRFVRELTS